MFKKLSVDKNLHILIVKDKGKKVFLAHCLDMDIVSQGKTPKEAISELIGLIKTQMEYCLENDMLDTLFRPAPKEYWDMYHRSQAIKILNQLSLHSKDIIKNLTTPVLNTGLCLRINTSNTENCVNS